MRHNALALALAAAGLFGSGVAEAATSLPGFIVPGSVIATDYDGVTDDLLSGGLGRTGLQSATPPGFANPMAPTAAELRRLAIYTNYRAIIDVSAGGGFGVFQGPGVDKNYKDTGTQGLVAGREYLAYAADESGRDPITVMVDIPKNFDRAHPCIVTAPASGSRGVYGAISAAEWGFNNGCVVALTDKGTGNGAHDLSRGLVYSIQGVRGTVAQLAGKAQFQVRQSAALDAFVASHPNRLAFKQADSRKNVEADWGQDVLKSIRFAFWAVNDFVGKPGQFTPKNTHVIASGISNGGGSALRAAEQDVERIISGVVVSEPQVQPDLRGRVSIMDRGTLYNRTGMNLAAYITLLDTYAPCASLAPSLTTTLFAGIEAINTPATPKGARANVCQGLKERGLLQGADLASQSAEALDLIHGAGLLPDMDYQFAAYEALNTWRNLAGTYVSSYLGGSVQEAICGVTFAAVDPVTGLPVPLADTLGVKLFGAGSGLPATGGVQLINELGVGGAGLLTASISPSTKRADLGFDNALCYRSIVTGQRIPGVAQNAALRFNQLREQIGLAEVRASGSLHGLPTIIVQGRSDLILGPNFTGRAYFGLNRLVDGAKSKSVYMEIENGTHLDALIPTFGNVGVPVHRYYTLALDAMLAHLRQGSPLPQSQVIHTTARKTNSFTADNYLQFLPLPSATPAQGDVITATNGRVTISQ